MSHNTNEGEGAPAAGADAAAAAAAAAAGGGDGAGGQAGGTAAGQGGEGGAFAAAAASGGDAGAGGGAAAVAAVPLAERIPEKLRVSKEDGTLDLEASAAKLADGYAQLEKRLGTGDAPPKAPEDYAPKTERFDMEALKSDPEYQSFLKGAHAKGITNDQLSFVLDTFADRVEKLGNGQMSTADFQAEMQANHWKGAGEYEANMALGLKAIRAFAPDITAEEIASIPNSPVVAKLLAAVGKEVGEDRQIQHAAGISAADFDSQVAALQASEAYNNANHPEHKKALAQMDELFAKRYPPSKAS